MNLGGPGKLFRTSDRQGEKGLGSH